MRYQITKSIDIDFAHHVAGHTGACINIHGHTWKFEVTLGADVLDDTGFVIDFGELKRKVLTPVHELFDHALLLRKEAIESPLMIEGLSMVGEQLLATRKLPQAVPPTPWRQANTILCGAESARLGGLKIALTPFSPTSERLAQWLFDVSRHNLQSDRVRVVEARVYETLHPVIAVATYSDVR